MRTGHFAAIGLCLALSLAPMGMAQQFGTGTTLKTRKAVPGLDKPTNPTTDQLLTSTLEILGKRYFEVSASGSYTVRELHCDLALYERSYIGKQDPQDGANITVNDRFLATQKDKKGEWCKGIHFYGKVVSSFIQSDRISGEGYITHFATPTNVCTDDHDEPLTDFTFGPQKKCALGQLQALLGTLEKTEHDSLLKDLRLRQIEIQFVDNFHGIKKDVEITYGPYLDAKQGKLLLRVVRSSKNECIYANPEQLGTAFTAWEQARNAGAR